MKLNKLVFAVLALASIAGEVKKIDEGAGKITLKHGAAKSLGMDEPMTMVYRVKDVAMFKQVKVGDKVSFEADNADAGYTDSEDEVKYNRGAALSPTR